MRVAVITGGAGGLGSALVQQLVDKGWNIVVLDINSFSIDKLPKEKRSCVVNIRCDFSESLPAIFEQWPKNWPMASLLILNAAMRDKPARVWEKGNDKVMIVNIISFRAICQLFVPKMIEQGYGHVISVGSVMSLYSVGGQGWYSISKGAVKSFMETLRQDLLTLEHGGRGIGTTLVMLGQLEDTAMFRKFDIPFRFLLTPISCEQTAIRIVHRIENWSNNNIICASKSSYTWTERPSLFTACRQSAKRWGHDEFICYPLYVLILFWFISFIPSSLLDLFNLWNGGSIADQVLTKEETKPKEQ